MLSVDFNRIKNQVSIIEEESREAVRLLEALYSLKMLSNDPRPFDRQIEFVIRQKKRIERRRQLLEDIEYLLSDSVHNSEDKLQDAISVLTNMT